ncbi:MAG TPA: dTDP-4-dehydrorhamnose reductase [Candidatus Acidoferrales bacterium]|nr:dTDP-4-dehydrorhamnose reductase [Candidatus Acidoferrales bacterium]
MAVLDRVVIIGASGQLGSDLIKAFRDLDPVGLTHGQVDVTAPGSLLYALRRWRPTAVINTAAYHNVDQCEAFPDRAFAVNALAVDSLAALCATEGVVLCHVSTDYVFSGDSSEPYGEDDAARPINAYGCSKLSGENLMMRHAREQYIFRTSGLFGVSQTMQKGLNFVERMIRAGEESKPLRVVDDVHFSPSYTLDVARAIRRILNGSPYGTYHVTNTGVCSWYDLAEEALRAAGLETPVERIKSPQDQFPKRPAMSALRHDAICAAGIEDLPSWKDGVRAYVEERNAANVLA